MSYTKVKLDLSEWELLHKHFADAVDTWPTALSIILGEIGDVAKDEVRRVYSTETAPDSNDELPTRYKGGLGKGIQMRRGGGKIRPWITIISTAPYARTIETGGPAIGAAVGINAKGNQRGSSKRFGGVAYRRYTGEFADAIYTWSKEKMGRGNKFAENVINKILEEGIQGRWVIHRALGSSNVGFTHYVRTTVEWRVSEFINRLLVK